MFNTPNPGFSQDQDVHAQIGCLSMLLNDLNPSSVEDAPSAQYYRGEIERLESLLQDGPSPTNTGQKFNWDHASEASGSGAPTPSGSGAPTPSDCASLASSASNSRKRNFHPEANVEPPFTSKRQNENTLAFRPQLPTLHPHLWPQTQTRIHAQPQVLPQFTFDGGSLTSFRDPFPELNYAFQGDGNLPQQSGPADAFNQEFMPEWDLAEYLLRPLTPPRQIPAPTIPTFQATSNGLPRFGYSDANSYGSGKHAFDMDSDTDDQSPVFPDGGYASRHLEELIEGIADDEEVARELREGTPRAMCSSLMEHQKLALTWLKKIEAGNTKGGILADDMGLGKTVQAIALIVARPSEELSCKTTLIIAPVALMRQWEKEIERHIHRNQRLSVYIYHGNGKRAEFSELRQYDVVLTTFGTLTSELKQVEKDSRIDPRPVRRGKSKTALIGRECMWYRVIIDEAQCIKNKNTFASRAANELQAKYRLCMTGTPMMNSIDELYSLIRFLQIKPYNDWARFRAHITTPIKSNRQRSMGIKRVQVLLRTFMLRRTKNTKIDGREICQIPPKHTHQERVEFSDEEQELYKAIETKSQLKLNKYLEKGTVTNNYANILVLLLRLRQACCHPHLIKDLGVQVSTEGIAEEVLLDRANSLQPDVIKRLKESDGFECPICMEGILNPTIFLPCGHTCCGECFQKLIDPTRAIREGNENGDAKCPNCRGPLSSNNITDYRHFCKAYCREKLHIFGFVEDEEVEEEQGAESDSGSEDSSDEEEEEDGDLDGFVVPDHVNDEDDYKPVKYEDAIDSATEGADAPATNKKKKKSTVKHINKGKGKAPAKPKKTLAQLKKESLRNKAAKGRYIRRLTKTFVTSSKIDETMRLVTEVHKNDPTEKILVFSQFTTLLDLLEVPLSEKNIFYQRYDGSMKMDDRADAVNKFMDDPSQQLMLISLKAGNAGLNLNKASQVILLDPFWNPYIEDQAVDRAHRMPQQREVHVHRLLVPETVEDRIVTLQEKKRELIGAALDEKAAKGVSRLSINDLKYLFGLGGRPSA